MPRFAQVRIEDQKMTYEESHHVRGVVDRLASGAKVDLTIGELIDLRDTGLIGFTIEAGHTKIWLTDKGKEKAAQGRNL
jgi:hypothetical protein